MQITEQNKPYLIGMVFIAILLIGTVYVFISTITDTINSDLNEIEENKKEIVEDKENNETEVVEEKTTVQECLADLGYNEFIFLHSPSCGHCRTMMPIVESLISEGYDIQIVNAIENSNFAKISNCISGMKGSVPQFICNKNGIPKIGSMTKEKLIEVYNSC
jgi:thiol-disulfide isomerase/thioredoxin